MKKRLLLSSLLVATLSSQLWSGVEFSKKTQALKVRVDSPISSADKEKLYRHGVATIRPAGGLYYYLYGDARHLKDAAELLPQVREVEVIDSKDRLDTELYQSTTKHISSLSSDEKFEISVLFLDEISKEECEAYLHSQGIDAEITSANPTLRSMKMRIDREGVEKLKSWGAIEYIQKSVILGVKNSKTRSYEGVNSVSDISNGLHAKGLRVAVVDGGLVRATHQEFMDNGKSRVHDVGGYSYADHATHVAGTIGAAGIDTKAHGMADGAEIYSFSFYDGAFADKVVDIYQNYNILFSNHSYGYNEKSQLGEYDLEAVKYDRAVWQNPFLNIFQAAGNDGANPDYPQYGQIKGVANAKNIITVGALNFNVSGHAKFSSTGPVKDGRIKPDLCVRGDGIYSSGANSDQDYLWMNGTSMATPAATGMGLLVDEAYKRVSGGYDIRHDILKAALINSAVDKGRVGPDYETGFGMINVKGAIKEVESITTPKPLLYSGHLTNAKTKVYQFDIKKPTDFKATLAWVDPAGSPQSATSLINDLDMVLIDEKGKRFYPYTLNPMSPTDLARQDRENHVDNVEQIVAKSLPKGSYRLVVKGSVVTTSQQDFALATNFSIDSKSNIATILPSKLKNFAKVIQSSLR